MSTQHPDNANPPPFATADIINGEEEIVEAYHVFSALGCDEQMWDCEGKEVDNFVVKKLLTAHPAFFNKSQLGKEVFITLRIPNPVVEKAEAKIVLETLESIPRSFDAAKLVTGKDMAPIFEIILPMTTSSDDIDRIYHCYTDFVVGKQSQQIRKGDITMAEWIGEFKPDRINVIPLFEEMEHMLNAHHVVEKYLKDKDVSYQRVFLARSDPALNYGLVSAVLLNKIALHNLHLLSKKIGKKIYPIIGVGPVPFRGGLRPSTAARIAKAYPSVATFTIQSSFKYDHPEKEVKAAIKTLLEKPISSPLPVDEKACLGIIKKYSAEYTRQIRILAPIINEIANYVPARRRRKLHIGLFGYSRDVGRIKLPRAITFTAALYSIGLPPEILGLNALTEKDRKELQKWYLYFNDDLRDALQYFNPAVLGVLPKELDIRTSEFPVKTAAHQDHLQLTSKAIKAWKGKDEKALRDTIVQAAKVRRFLG